MARLVLGYDFECKQFMFQGREVQALCFEIITNEKISRKNVDNIVVELSKEDGFWVKIHQNAKRIKVEPYKSYVLVPCKDDPRGLELEPMEISHKALMKHADCFEGERSRMPSSEYYIE